MLGDFARRIEEAAPRRAGKGATDADSPHAEIGKLRVHPDRPSFEAALRAALVGAGVPR